VRRWPAVTSGRRAGTIRTGNGIDSHAAVTRFLGLSSDVLMADRHPRGDRKILRLGLGDRGDHLDHFAMPGERFRISLLLGQHIAQRCSRVAQHLKSLAIRSVVR